MKILAFAGSNSSQSKNKELVKYVLKSFGNEEVNFLDLNDFEMLIYSEDREKQGFPAEAHQFVDAIANCDAIICSLAEHNRTYSTAFKNVFDWASRINKNLFQGKPMLLMTTSPGAFGGGNVMAEAQKFFPQFGADIRESYSLPSFMENFDRENKEVKNPEMKAELDRKIENFKQNIRNDRN